MGFLLFLAFARNIKQKNIYLHTKTEAGTRGRRLFFGITERIKAVEEKLEVKLKNESGEPKLKNRREIEKPLREPNLARRTATERKRERETAVEKETGSREPTKNRTVDSRDPGI